MALLRLRRGQPALDLGGLSLPVAGLDDDEAIKQAVTAGHAVAVAGLGVLTVSATVHGAINLLEQLEQATTTELAVARAS